LPLTVIEPGVDDGFVVRVEGEQDGDKSRRKFGSTAPRSEVGTKGTLDLISVDQTAQAHQGVAHVNQLVELGDKQLVSLGCSGHESNDQT
jgi:hypothetical protein